MVFHYVYIVRERENIRFKEPVYKIGKTKQQSAQRVKSYPKDSEGVIMEQVSDAEKAERRIIRKFTKEFKHRPDIGREYFQGSVLRMKEFFREICDKFSPHKENDSPSEETMSSEESTESDASSSTEERIQAELTKVSLKYQRRLLILKTNRLFVQKINKVLSNLNYQITGNEEDYVSLGNIMKEYTYVFPSSNRSFKTRFGDFGLDRILKIMIWNEMFRKGKLRSGLSKKSGAVKEIEIRILDGGDVLDHRPYNIAISGIKSNRSFTEYDKTNLIRDVKVVALIPLGCSHTLEDFVDSPMKKKELIKIIDFVEKHYVPRSLDSNPKFDSDESNLMSLSRIQDDGDVYGRHISLAACLILGFTMLPHCDQKKKRNDLYSVYFPFLFRDDHVSSLVQVELEKEKEWRDEHMSKLWVCSSHKVPANKNCPICEPLLETSKLTLKCLTLKEDFVFWASEEHRQLEFLKTRIRDHKPSPGSWDWFSDVPKTLKTKLTVHLKLRGEMEKFIRILMFLIDQFGFRKSAKNPLCPGKFYFNEQSDKIYRECLFFGSKGWFCFQDPISTFMCNMDSLIYAELEDEIKKYGGSPMEFYYHHQNKPYQLRYDSFSPEDWMLEENFDVTPSDKLKLLEFKKLMIGTMDKCISEFKKSPKPWRGKDKLLKELLEKRNYYDKLFVL